MTASLVYVPRALWIAALVGITVYAVHLAAPQVALATTPPVENTHLLPEQHEAFREAMEALDKPATMVC
ncbi:MAG: hypothetical protein AAGC86_14140 [Pseudomonadota bacterium]